MKSLCPLVICGVLTVATMAELALLGALPYSTSWFVPVADAEALSPPEPAFAIGVVRWPVDEFAKQQALDDFRESFLARCSVTRPVEAALCISDRMAAQFPHGEPGEEFVAPSFEPSRHLKRHSAGEPGHCVNRSAIMAAELLSIGIPARVVQLVPLDGSGGHNLVEVFEPEHGWVMVDPTYGGLVGDVAGPRSALAMTAFPDAVRWHAVGVVPEPLKIESHEMELLYRRLLRATVLYPEPWLYLRIGEKRAPWPYRGAFVQTGPRGFMVGPVHRLLRWVLPLTAGAATLGLAVVLVTRVRATKSVSPPL